MHLVVLFVDLIVCLHHKQVVSAILGLGAIAVAAPLAQKSSCVYTCGSVCYWQNDIDAALNQGYQDLQDDNSPGTKPAANSASALQTWLTISLGNYPHQYNDYEGFKFPTSAPWYEFPILSSFKVYTGGSPGADRVIFDGNGNFDSLITHTGASGNNFVACKKN